MKFEWTNQEEEKYYLKAEEQLKRESIDYVKVNRERFSVIGYNPEQKTVKEVRVHLKAIPNRLLTGKRLKRLKELKNWKREKVPEGDFDCPTLHPIFTYSYLAYVADEGRKLRKCQRKS